jgi:hypothetical protein
MRGHRASQRKAKSNCGLGVEKQDVFVRQQLTSLPEPLEEAKTGAGEGSATNDGATSRSSSFPDRQDACVIPGSGTTAGLILEAGLSTTYLCSSLEL